jgi:hypothetical protein
MRKIEQQLAAAIRDGRDFRAGTRDRVRRDPATGDLQVELHGSRIATIPANNLHAPPRVLVSLCGWDTPTTRSRVNVVLAALVPGAYVAHMRGRTVLMHNGAGHVMDPSATYPLGRDVAIGGAA